MACERLVEEQVAHAIAIYERGILTRWEVVRKISGYATRPGFFECLEGLPPELVEGLREIASGAPAHPEDAIIGNALYQPMTEEEFKALRRRARLGAYWTSRLLRM